MSDSPKEITLKKKQVAMHRDFFKRAGLAMNNGFYLEAIFLEYAAIESRLEVMLGVLGYPCHKNIDARIRVGVNISDRIECLRVCRNKNPMIFEKSKLPDNFLTPKGTLQKWIKDRNQYIHGLYKNADDYLVRKQDFKRVATDGYEYSRLLYNEVLRLRRLQKRDPQLFANAVCECKNKGCVAAKK